MAFWPFISFYFCLLGLHFLLFWPFGPSFAFIFCLPAAWGPPHKLPKMVRFLNVPHKEFNSARSGCIFQFLAFSAFFNSFWPFGLHCLSFWPFGLFISFQFGVLALHCLSFWPFGPSFSFIFCLPGLPRGILPTSYQKWLVFLMSRIKNLTAPGPVAFSNFWPFRPFSVHFGLLGLHCLSFWPFGPSFPSILAFWAFISFHFGVLGFYCLSFSPFGPSFSFIFCLPGLPRGVPPTSCQKWLVFLMSHIKNLTAPNPAAFSNFWPFGPSFPFTLAISVLGKHILASSVPGKAHFFLLFLFLESSTLASSVPGKHPLAISVFGKAHFGHFCPWKPLFGHSCLW